MPPIELIWCKPTNWLEELLYLPREFEILGGVCEFNQNPDGEFATDTGSRLGDDGVNTDDKFRFKGMFCGLVIDANSDPLGIPGEVIFW